MGYGLSDDPFGKFLGATSMINLFSKTESSREWLVSESKVVAERMGDCFQAPHQVPTHLKILHMETIKFIKDNTVSWEEIPEKYKDPKGSSIHRDVFMCVVFSQDGEADVRFTTREQMPLGIEEAAEIQLLIAGLARDAGDANPKLLMKVGELSNRMQMVKYRDDFALGRRQRIARQKPRKGGDVLPEERKIILDRVQYYMNKKHAKLQSCRIVSDELKDGKCPDVEGTRIVAPNTIRNWKVAR